MASTNPFLTLYSTVQTNLVGSTITTGYIPYISTAGRQNYSNTLSTLTVSTISGAVNEPTVKRYTSSSGSYTPTSAGVVRIKVRMCGGGGGGGGAYSSGVTQNGGDTTFGGWTCKGGSGSSPVAGGILGGAGGNGGATGIGTGTLIVRIPGSPGENGLWNGTVGSLGGMGGSNMFNSAGVGGGVPELSGASAVPNTGGGGGGGGCSGTAASGGGGGAGEYMEFYTNPGTISYSVGGGGSGGSGRYGSGGAGAAGIIIIEEFYI